MSSMTPIGATSYAPQLQRVSLPRPSAFNDQVYDPVLDPTRVQKPTSLDSVTVVAGQQEGKPNADDEPFSFWDLLDVINPLQHIPGVNTIYRELTGDTIKTPIKMIGATVLGGPIGFAAALADSVVAKTTGKDIGEHAMALFQADDPAASSPNYSAPVLAQAPRSIDAPVTMAPPVDDAVADPLLMAGGSQPPPPSEAEAFVQTAQIAAQANVFPSFKRDAAKLGGATDQQKAESEVKLAAAQASAARGEMRFMPLQGGGPRATGTVARREGDTTSMSELKARSKFAPGPRNVGGAQLAPATLAAATAAQAAKPNATAESGINQGVRPVDAYAYGRQTAAGTQPAEVPAWFDQAMLNAIDKYKAMQSAP